MPDGATGRPARREGQPSAERAAPPAFPFPPEAEKPWTPEDVAEVLNRLPFVRWDRLIPAPVEEHHTLTAYGWIDRDDNRSDFVTVSFVSWAEELAFSTSSALWSPEINRLLCGDAPHYECVTIQDVLGDLVARKVLRG